MATRSSKVAFVSGVNGITGFSIVEHLIRQPKEEWSKIIISSRSPLKYFWADPRIDFVAIDFLEPVEEIKKKLPEAAKGITHAYYCSYVHDADFKKLKDKNVPLFKNFIDTIDTLCPDLNRIVLQTGGKHYGAHLGPLHKVPITEDFPRYNDEGYNFYYQEEDYMFELQKKRNTWSYNIVRPNGIVGYTPGVNGMSEALAFSIYFLICRELNEPPKFSGNEYFWSAPIDVSYAPGIADLIVWASTQDHTRNEAFNHVNGDIFLWKHMYPDLAKYFGVDVPEQKFEKAKGQSNTLSNEYDMIEWAKDKRPVWEAVVKKHGGNVEAFDWVQWDFMNWALGMSWPSFLSMDKARKFGWTRHDDSLECFLDTFKVFENAGVLPASKN
ncbi:nad dependent epimerase dehydratase family protein [Phlyctema vagabunda]|uniref:Nad dependent epimerase dehydratase family protein n=1 Tax=Phlyctema vagabunda TaxID=108571 RepID=A0ABR4PH46_9HELO